ncbi:zinc ribbon domain-containing protein [Sinobaca sp. H24]|uniref:FmdB family zinc ribbon protein n=1 Tax=Sinobaca sp. H24 TaxID=2923376 RepID=UPI00207AF180|nr:zinc ribbon domain-containing protein [Sinobaca sp. H24]
MPVYTFECGEGDRFDEFHSSTKGDKSRAVCPACGGEAKRLFFAPSVYKMNSTVKQKIDSGAEPTLRKKGEPAGTPIRKKRPPVSRPWQIGG